MLLYLPEGPGWVPAADGGGLPAFPGGGCRRIWATSRVITCLSLSESRNFVCGFGFASVSESLIVSCENGGSGEAMLSREQRKNPSS